MLLVVGRTLGAIVVLCVPVLPAPMDALPNLLADSGVFGTPVFSVLTLHDMKFSRLRTRVPLPMCLLFGRGLLFAFSYSSWIGTT